MYVVNTGPSTPLPGASRAESEVEPAAGDSTTAEQHYRAQLAIAERLVATDPGNAGYQRDLSVSHNRLGDLAVAEPRTEVPGV